MYRGRGRSRGPSASAHPRESFFRLGPAATQILATEAASAAGINQLSSLTSPNTFTALLFTPRVGPGPPGPAALSVGVAQF